MRKATAEFSASAPSVYKSPPPMGPHFSTLVLGRVGKFEGVPTTPNPNTSAKVSRYKWEAYRDTNWWCV